MTAPSPERLALRRFINEQRIECGLESIWFGMPVVARFHFDGTKLADAIAKVNKAMAQMAGVLNRKPRDDDPAPTFDAVAADLGWQP